jgi:hypothetical protein
MPATEQRCHRLIGVTGVSQSLTWWELSGDKNETNNTHIPINDWNKYYLF